MTGPIILDDFNIHYGKSGNKDSDAFFDLLYTTKFQRHVRLPKHIIGNILDLVMTPSSGSIVTSVTVGSIAHRSPRYDVSDGGLPAHQSPRCDISDGGVPVHRSPRCALHTPCTNAESKEKQVSYRKYVAINSTKFRSDVELSHLLTSPCNNIAGPNTLWHTKEVLLSENLGKPSRSGGSQNCRFIAKSTRNCAVLHTQCLTFAAN